MYRATTPKHTFCFDVNAEDTFNTILITYVQDGEIVFEKGKSDLTFLEGEVVDGKTVFAAYLRLTQEETKLFNNRSPVKVQVRAVSINGEVVASKIMSVPINDVLNDEVLT